MTPFDGVPQRACEVGPFTVTDIAVTLLFQTISLSRFNVIKKCTNEVDCLVNEMLSIQDLKPALNVQSDSLCANYKVSMKLGWHFSFKSKFAST